MANGELRLRSESEPALYRKRHYMKTQQGFTLIELMIVMVVIAILTAVALPSYTKYVTRGRIPDATSNLATLRVKMEQYYQDNRTYIGGPGCVIDTTTSKYFDFGCPGAGAATATTYIITATGKNQMNGFKYTIDQSGGKTSTFTAPATTSGWSSPSPNNCWATNVGGTC
jgi:type IV pilus assembly protein PilE